MANLTRYTAAKWDFDTFYIFEDFPNDQSDLFWVDTITDTGTALIGDEASGVVTLTPSDGTVADNDEVYLATANELFLFAANRQITGECRLRFASTASGVYNVAFGFMNAVGADAILDNGGGLKVSGSTLAIYKIDGETVWRCVSANNGVSTVTVSAKTASPATWTRLTIQAVDSGDGRMLASFLVDGEILKDTNGNPIRHTITHASATEMQCFVGAKLGAGTNNDATKVDWVYAAQTR